MGTYPFTVNEDPLVVHAEMARHIGAFLGNAFFENLPKDKLFDYFRNHFLLANSLFAEEDHARKEGRENANLYYHCKEHAVYQATYDTITVVDAILKRNDKLSLHLTAEGAIAAVLAATYHDVGYVYGVEPDENYAARLNIHVTEGIRASDEILDIIPTPAFLNKTKIKRLVKLGMHVTNFPITQEHKNEARRLLDALSPKNRKEAHLVRIAVQLGDLGGQVARKDYRDLLKDLRVEQNCAEPGSGDELIGVDESDTQSKCHQFIEACIKPTVGKSANAIFKSQRNIFSEAWDQGSTID